MGYYYEASINGKIEDFGKKCNSICYSDPKYLLFYEETQNEKEDKCLIILGMFRHEQVEWVKKREK